VPEEHAGPEGQRVGQERVSPAPVQDDAGDRGSLAETPGELVVNDQNERDNQA
jgi:hypothetical protein